MVAPKAGSVTISPGKRFGCAESRSTSRVDQQGEVVADAATPLSLRPTLLPAVSAPAPLRSELGDLPAHRALERVTRNKVMQYPQGNEFCLD